jgi:hypothetical protein
MSPVVKYFNNEKAESYLFILIGVIVILMALYFLFVLKTSFWKGMAMPFLLVASLEIIVGYTIVTRSPKDLVRVEEFVKNQTQKIITSEIPRMEKVMNNFTIYRYVEIILIILGIVLMYSSTKDTFWRGIGLGLFSQASIVLCLDFFAERRGHIYLEFLKDLSVKV